MADQGTEGLLSPFLRRRRIAAVRPLLNGRVLDVGCGSGALAEHVPASRYVGFDPDPLSIEIAQKAHPEHRFVTSLAEAGEGFNTIVSLAVIEHVPDAAAFLRALGDRLGDGRDDWIVLTTPHPAVDWLHTAGASIGLFSSHASDEHEELLDRPRLQQLAEGSAFRLAYYRRFLFGANQVALYRRAKAGV